MADPSEDARRDAHRTAVFKYFTLFVVALAFGLFAAYAGSDARECGGPVSGLALALFGYVVFGLALLLAICAAIVAVIGRSRTIWVSLGLAAAGLVVGWYVGLALVGS